MSNEPFEEESEFESAARKGRASLVTEFVLFLKDNKKWWLMPILLVIAALALLTFFGGTGAAPFIYTMF